MEKYKQYRLRKGNQIIAYAEEKNTGVHFTGKHLLFWRVGQQSFDAVDEATPFLDKMNRRIYEGDIVRYKINWQTMYSQAVILKVKYQFKLLDLTTGVCMPLELEGFYLFQNEPLEIVSHIFTNAMIAERLQEWKV